GLFQGMSSADGANCDSDFLLGPRALEWLRTVEAGHFYIEFAEAGSGEEIDTEFLDCRWVAEQCRCGEEPPGALCALAAPTDAFGSVAARRPEIGVDIFGQR